MERLTELRTEIARLVKQGVCLAFSGGVDSALLLALAAEAQRSGGGEIQAVTFPPGSIRSRISTMRGGLPARRECRFT